MGKIDERIAHLMGDIEELRVKSDESGIKYQSSTRFFNVIKDIDLSSIQNLQFLLKSVREILSNQLEYLRDRIDIIQKVSPKTAQRLNEQVTKHEKKAMDLIEELENQKSIKQADEFLSNRDTQLSLIQMQLNITSTLSSVETCYDFFIDTLSYLENKENSPEK